MDQLFQRDTMQTRTILEMICIRLTWKDLLSLKDVSRLSREVVKEHRHLARVGLCEPHRVETINQSRVGLTDSKGDVGSDHGDGPILTNLCIDTLIESKEAILSGTGLDWMMNSLSRDETYLEVKQLQLYVGATRIATKDINDFTALNSRAEAMLADQRITFANCTRLSIIIRPTVLILPNLLRYFPSLEHIDLQASYPPLLSHLPAPQKLRSLRVYINVPDTWRQTTQEVHPIIINLSSIETLDLDFNPDSGELVTQENEDTTLMSLTTGVRWLASLSQHPPLKLEHFMLSYLTNWSTPLLELCCRLSPTFRSLRLGILWAKSIPLIDILQQVLLSNGETGVLQRITKLHNHIIESESAFARLLALTPSVEDLEIWIDWKFNKSERAVMQSIMSLKSLKRLTVHGPYWSDDCLPDWLETIKRNATSQLTLKVYGHY